jgi:hypothetical protein
VPVCELDAVRVDVDVVVGVDDAVRVDVLVWVAVALADGVGSTSGGSATPRKSWWAGAVPKTDKCCAASSQRYSVVDVTAYTTNACTLAPRRVSVSVRPQME